MIPGGPETGKELVAHPDIDGVLFTGSAHMASRSTASWPRILARSARSKWVATTP